MHHLKSPISPCLETEKGGKNAATTCVNPSANTIFAQTISSPNTRTTSPPPKPLHHSKATKQRKPPVLTVSSILPALAARCVPYLHQRAPNPLPPVIKTPLVFAPINERLSPRGLLNQPVRLFGVAWLGGGGKGCCQRPSLCSPINIDIMH